MDVIKADNWLETRAELGEGLQLFPDGSLWWVDIPKGEVNQIIEGVSVNRHKFEHEVSKVLPWRHGYLVLGREFVHGFDVDNGEILRLRIHQDDSGLRCSDATVLPDGSVVFGSVDLELRPGVGSLQHISNDWEISRLIEGATIPNGIAVSPEKSEFVWVDSPTHQLLRFAISSSQSGFEQLGVFGAISPELGVPDGLTFDASGGIWVALWGGERVVRIDVSGEIDVVVEIGTRNPTSCAFDSQHNLVITTALATLTEQEAARPGAGGIWRVPAAEHGRRGLQPIVAQLDFLKQASGETKPALGVIQ